MECKKCGIDLSGREYKNVAQWPFCLACFQALMEKAEARKEEMVEASKPEPAGKRQKCLICETQIDQSTGHEMLGLMFCQACYQNLIHTPDIPPRQENGGRETAAAPAEKPAVAQVRVDFHRPVQCDGCGRQIPGIGSKPFGGNSYCPDCYSRLPDIQAQKPKPFQKTASGKQAEAEKARLSPGKQTAGFRCQACQRSTLPANLRTEEGFEICLACLATNRDTAIDIARTRHRKALESIKRELDR